MLDDDWMQAWWQAGRSLLNLEFNALWLGTMALRTTSVRKNKWGKVGSIIQLFGFPVGLVASMIANNSDASKWGLIPLAISFIFIVIFIVTMPESERDALRASRLAKWNAFKAKMK